MNRLTMIGMALAISAPALPAMAQQAQPADPAPYPAASPETTAPAQAEQVAAVVDKDFPSYDADKSGQLDKSEFSKWVLALKGEELKAAGKTLPEPDMKAWATAAFSTADTDKSTTISKAELGKFLGG